MRSKKVLIIDDEKLIRWSLAQKFFEWNMDAVTVENGKAALSLIPKEMPDLVMLDNRLPDKKGTDILKEIKTRWPEIPVVMITAYGSVDDVVTAMRRGAYDFITKPIDFTKLQSIVKNALETASLKKEIAYFKEKEKSKFDPEQIVAVSQTMKQVLNMSRKIALSEASIVLLQGESGTGKDLLAQAIHHLSRRKNASYLAINCSAIPENLLESELFGYEKGAFTDAKQQKQGLAELADEGTLFLDEISTLDIHLQAKLLRFLETQTFKHVGGLKDIEVDIRVVAATNKDLEAAVQEGTFRQDLLYRLNACPIYIPPLRDRKEDVIPLAEHFIRDQNTKFRKDIKGLDKQAQKVFLEYAWPGNVRELKNAIERAMIFEDASFISTKYLPIQPGAPSLVRSSQPSQHIDFNIGLKEMEKKLILNALKRAKGNKSQAAKLLGITRDTLRYKIKKFAIHSDDY
jgi:DNA-binding NtrC family response regulator